MPLKSSGVGSGAVPFRAEQPARRSTAARARTALWKGLTVAKPLTVGAGSLSRREPTRGDPLERLERGRIGQRIARGRDLGQSPEQDSLHRNLELLARQRSR